MIRSEFLEIDCWSDLKEFCYDYDCDILCDIYESDDLDSMVCDDIRSSTSNMYWNEIRDALHGIPDLDDGQYFRCDGVFDYESLDDESDFEHYKNKVLEWGDENEIWDEEDDESYWPDLSDEEEDSGEDIWEPATADELELLYKEVYRKQ